ncbi:hypothetical protein RhiirA4_486000 [Rhizophagus irregularis]|nr:hypothetical protein RhiirA4_486000 [Rhizophagus irregularis]
MSLSFRMVLAFSSWALDITLDIGSFGYISDILVMGIVSVQLLFRLWIDRHRRRLAESLDPWIEFQSIQIPGW